MKGEYEMHQLNQEKKRVEKIATQLLAGLIASSNITDKETITRAISLAENLIKQLDKRHLQAILKKAVDEKL